MAAAAHEHRKARAHWSALQERFPGAQHLMLEQAKVRLSFEVLKIFEKPYLFSTSENADNLTCFQYVSENI